MGGGNAYIIDIAPRVAGINLTSKILPLCFNQNIISCWINYLLNKKFNFHNNIINKALIQYFPFENCHILYLPDLNKLKNEYNM